MRDTRTVPEALEGDPRRHTAHLAALASRQARTVLWRDRNTDSRPPGPYPLDKQFNWRPVTPISCNLAVSTPLSMRFMGAPLSHIRNLRVGSGGRVRRGRSLSSSRRPRKTLPTANRPRRRRTLASKARSKTAADVQPRSRLDFSANGFPWAAPTATQVDPLQESSGPVSWSKLTRFRGSSWPGFGGSGRVAFGKTERWEWLESEMRESIATPKPSGLEAPPGLPPAMSGDTNAQCPVSPLPCRVVTPTATSTGLSVSASRRRQAA